MEKRNEHLWIALLLFLFCGCVTEYRPTKSGLELQAFQKKEFETNKKIAFASVLSVFQDMGYTISSASLETGLITSKSPTASGPGFLGLSTVMLDTKATAFVEELRPGSTSIRLNFVKSREESGGYGQKQAYDNPVEDPKVYEDVFIKIRQAIFVRSSSQ
jgi:hypothetical protein